MDEKSTSGPRTGEERMIRQSIELWVENAGRVLLLRVAAGRDHPAFWQPVTGGVEGEEDVREAAVRELREETGLIASSSDLDLVARDILVPISSDLSVNKALFRLCTDESEVTVNPEEHTDFRWVDAAEVEDRLFWESNRTTWGLVRPSP
ncbi:NUDIX domain-containing protein [Xylanimonas protaetiae]|nr:NUDIX domain-containing protein [Xylanimonas protaetiae]